MAKKLYGMYAKAADAGSHVFLLAVRVLWGYAFFQAGYGKLFTQGIDAVAGFFSQTTVLGQYVLPLPTASAYVVATTEMVGGLLLIIGLGSRLVALPLAIAMTVALLSAHWGAIATIPAEGFGAWFNNQLLVQAPLTYLFASLVILFFGPGMLSVDALVKRFVASERR